MSDNVVVELEVKAEHMIAAGRVDSQVFEQLKDWNKCNSGEKSVIPVLTHAQICLFSLACNNDFEATRKCISAYYKIKKNGPDIFNNRDPERDDIQFELKMLVYAVMPTRTKDNCAIVLHRLKNSNPSNYIMDVAMKIYFMVVDTLIYENPPDGLVFLFDMRDVGLMHLTRIKLHCLGLWFSYLQEALPIKLKEIHVFNVVWFFDKILAIMKPFIKGELMSKIHLHTSSLDMETFYKKHLPKSNLPSDFGGDLPTIDELSEETYQRLKKLKKYFEQEENQRNAISGHNL